MEILLGSTLREVERVAVEEYAIPISALMQNAAQALYEVCSEKAGAPPAKILILAGSGNNGGDALAAAKILISNGYNVSVLLAADSRPTQLCAAHRIALQELGADISEISSKEDIDVSKFQTDLIIDALLGIGANRPPAGVMADMIALANSAAALRISVDIPTGLMADTPHILGEVFRADVTVTFTRPKVSLHLAPSKAFCGEIIVKQVGLPQELITSPLHLLTEENTPHPPERTPFGYKNIYGHAVVVGGSLGKSGAAVIAACAALRSGAGLVACILPKSLIWALAAHPELMSFEAETDNIFSEKDASRILAFLKPDMTLAIGPGLGRDEQTLAFVRALIKGWAKQMVIDADALYALDEKTLALLTGRVALTPHFGEFLPLASRCFGAMDKQELILNRLEISREYAKRYSLFLLLKGSEMIISCPDGEQFISEWGSPCLSKGGSGDILTGVITALIAQGVKMQDALKTACRIQGTAGRIAAKGRCAYSVTPADIINSIGILES